MRSRPKTASFLLALTVGLLASATAYSVTVTNTNDSGPGSLRNAIAATPAGGLVNFSLAGCPCSIVLTTGELIITKNLTLVGPGADQLAISGNNSTRVFNIKGPGHPFGLIAVTIEGLAIRNGNAGPNPLTPAYNNFGGGIVSSNANLTIRRSVIADNFALKEGGGIAFYSGSFAASDTTFHRNTVGDPNSQNWERGGALITQGYGTTDITNCSFTENQGVGAIFIDFFMTARITGTTIARNRGLFGSGIYIFQHSTVEIANSTFEGNISELNGSIYVASASANFTNCTISGNIAHGGSAGLIFFNTDILRPDFPFLNARLQLTNTTITGNAGDTSPGGIWVDGEPGFPATAVFRNSIVAANDSDSDVQHTNNSVVESAGYNLIGNAGTETAFTKAGDQAGTQNLVTDPRLKPLADNGSPTKTHALKLDSPALDRGFAFGSALDQNAQPRVSDNPDLPNAPGGDGSDIGAAELQFPVSGTITIAGRVVVRGGEPVRRGTVTLADSSQNTRTVQLNPFGYFRFANVPLGRGFTIGVKTKNLAVEPRGIFTVGDLTDLRLIGQPMPR